MRLYPRQPVPLSRNTPKARAHDLRERIVAALHEHGAGRLEAIACRVQAPEHRVRYALSVLVTLERIHICAWDEVEGMKYEMRVPRYAHGPGRSAPPPPTAASHKPPEPSALDYNPGADLQEVTKQWGWASMKEQDDAVENSERDQEAGRG